MTKRVLTAILCFLGGLFPSFVIIILYSLFFGAISLETCAYIIGSVMMFFGIFGYIKPNLAVKILFPFSFFNPF